ncbi:MarR family winged helix-turn-helix transcriptional regulator [Microbacterium sp. 10M-3C3]|uniref:MarR family winged helix-turn-helix transcriptional regulator n=1 Tax=Microbacterium sp. 10M-3C3 TaxID=2483401 RepID=UPI0013DE7117|nr:MarR family winged helix-turn-helix transcriptional regulator [Microbacterium sp. 10M-3C3]
MTAPDPVDAIAAALARLRGPRPAPPWEGKGPWEGRGAWRGGHGPHDPDGHGSHGGRRGVGGPGGQAGPWGAGGPWAMRGGPRAGLARLRLLDALAAAEHPLSVGEAAEAIGVDQPRASRLVQQGEELGLLRREPDPDDARRTRIALTDAGAAFVRGFRDQRRDAVQSALADFSEAERAELARLLAKLADAWPRG